MVVVAVEASRDEFSRVLERRFHLRGQAGGYAVVTRWLRGGLTSGSGAAERSAIVFAAAASLRFASARAVSEADSASSLRRGSAT